MSRVSPVHTDLKHLQLLYAGLGADTRVRYSSAVKSYESLCAYQARSPWPATFGTLSKWIVTRAFGDPLIKLQGQIGGSSISHGLSALRSIHVDLHFDITVFDDPHLRRLITGVSSLFPRATRPPKVPILRDLLKNLFSPVATASENPHDTLNLNAAFAVAWAGFLRMGEFTWEKKDMLDIRTFQATRLTRRCVAMAPGRDYIRLLLPRSKTDKANLGVTIFLTASQDDTPCPVACLQSLFASPPGIADALFTFKDTKPFNKANVQRALGRRLRNLGITASGITGHSWRKGAMQQAHNDGVPLGRAMQIGRWTSDAAQLYFQQSDQQLLQIHREFMAGPMPPA